jgi:methylthioribose-1-phosphate isomerase
VKYLRIRELSVVIDAIRRLAVRGAPAIGVAAAYGVVLGLREEAPASAAGARRSFARVKERLAGSRPTAVNLFWSLDRMESRAEALEAEGASFPELLRGLLDEAIEIHEEDQRLCREIGRHGQKLLRSGWNVLTHCNAGALATGGMGTALAVIYSAVEKGKKIRVFADETRPLLQGARLTSWELRRVGVDVTVACDNAAASLMGSGQIQCVVVGADRIASNGDVANKIGTYGVAVLAREHDIPFYVAAPSSTFDPRTASGAGIPIEQRSNLEVTAGFGRKTVPPGVDVYNPAFDVTPARYVTGFITEQGLLEPPFKRNISGLFRTAATHG